MFYLSVKSTNLLDLFILATRVKKFGDFEAICTQGIFSITGVPLTIMCHGDEFQIIISRRVVEKAIRILTELNDDILNLQFVNSKIMFSNILIL